MTQYWKRKHYQTNLKKPRKIQVVGYINQLINHQQKSQIFLQRRNRKDGCHMNKPNNPAGANLDPRKIQDSVDKNTARIQKDNGTKKK
ncbi:hypothetical protein GCM10008982_22530 [Anoxybacillus voinovskiensis]|nr:hypothetical protein GCM10008982_22530 [Anoxybacillus voinovskiensis]